MKKLVLLLSLTILVLAFSSCSKYYDQASKIEGLWTWTYAVDGDGADLMQVYDYKTAEFKSDGTYYFDIDNYPHEGNWSVNDAGDILYLDGNEWSILTLTSSKLEIKGNYVDGYEWHFEK